MIIGARCLSRAAGGGPEMQAAVDRGCEGPFTSLRYAPLPSLQ